MIVWTADVSGTEDKYVAFFNSNDSLAGIVSLSLTELAIQGLYSAKDLWTKETSEVKDGILSREIAPHGSAMFRLSAQ